MMTRPSFRDVTYVGALLINGIVLVVNLWGFWRHPDAASSLVLIVVCFAMCLVVRNRELADEVRKVQRAEQHKVDTETKVAQAMLAHIEASKSLTLGIETPRAERRH